MEVPPGGEVELELRRRGYVTRRVTVTEATEGRVQLQMRPRRRPQPVHQDPGLNEMSAWKLGGDLDEAIKRILERSGPRG